MKVRIKNWDDAVKAALADVENWYVEDNSIFGIDRKLGKWGEIVEVNETMRRCLVAGDYAYPMCVVDELHDDKPNPDDVLRYGEIVTDDAYASVVTEFGKRQAVRIRLISYNGGLYYHKMVEGDVIDFRCVGTADA